MDLADILNREQIIPDLRATNRWEAIDELIGNLVATGKIQAADRDAVTAAVKKRETSMSTGIGFGIGIPHASTDLIFEVVGALGRSGKGVNFDALDNQPVKLVMLFPRAAGAIPKTSPHARQHRQTAAQSRISRSPRKIARRRRHARRHPRKREKMIRRFGGRVPAPTGRS
jgi:mannitol/fructose-specific phosphotransferase system IIA component (Ntr-type)